MHVARDAFRHRGKLRIGGRGLVTRLIVGIAHPINGSARRLLVERDAGFGGGFGEPVRQAVAAEAAVDHQVDVLHIGARLKVLDQTAERSGLNGIILGIHTYVLRYAGAVRRDMVTTV